MDKKRKLARTRGKHEIIDVTKSGAIEVILESPDFQNELHKSAVGVVVSRLESQAKEISENDLLDLIQTLLKPKASKQAAEIEKATDQVQSHNCLLKITVKKAVNLAPKDVDGSSDPYCLLGVVQTKHFTNLQKSENAVKQTSYKKSTLDPEWNETIELTVAREDVKEGYLQIQIWDHDDDNDHSKRVKGVRGAGRYLKEKAQAVTKKSDEQDDFMGFNSIPLCNIPSESLERWFTVRASALHNVSGRIKLLLDLNPIRENSNEPNNNGRFTRFGRDEIYAGLYWLIVKDAHAKHIKSSNETWDGNLPKLSEVMLKEMADQFCLSAMTRDIVRWYIFTTLHLAQDNKYDVDVNIFDGILTSIEKEAKNYNLENIHHNDENDTFNGNIFFLKLKDLVQNEMKKVVDHRRVFSSSRTNYVMALGGLLLMFKKIQNMSLNQHLSKYFIPEILAQIKDNIIQSLKVGTEEYYVLTYDNLLDESIEQQSDIPEGDLIFGGQEIRVLIKLAEKLYKDLLFARSVYHDIFHKFMDVDYMSLVVAIFSYHLTKDSAEALKPINIELVRIRDPNNPDSENKSSMLFRFYLSMKDIHQLHCKYSNSKDTADSMNNIGSYVESDSSSENTKLNNISNYQNMFRPTVLRWLQMSHRRTLIRLERAVELDKVDRVDDIVKHSSSAVDCISCLLGIITFWKSLAWPEPVDAYTIALRLTDDMTNATEFYADMVHRKLKKNGFFDDEGQFDVTQELCIALNNLEHVKAFLEDLPDKMEFDSLARNVDSHADGPDYEKVLGTFNKLLVSSKIGTKKKIKQITGIVGTKMKPDIARYLKYFGDTLSKCSDFKDFHIKQDEKTRKLLHTKALDAIQPLMQYLHDNVTTLNKWLCETNFKRILEVVWRVCLQCLNQTALIDFVQLRPYFFYQCSYVLKHEFVAFFHADKLGISMVRMQTNKEYEVLHSELTLRSARTEDLMRLFYLQMYEEQKKYEGNPMYGYLNVMAYYEPVKMELHVDVISGENFVPLDVNGFSDPFVKLRLAPKCLFLDQRSHQTLVQKKTLNPTFENESFTFILNPMQVEQEGTFIMFNVYDHDIISSNDLEGEAVLPLWILDGVANPGDHPELLTPEGKIDRIFKLPLTQPTQNFTNSGKQELTKKFATNESSEHIAEKSASKITIHDVKLDYDPDIIVSPIILLQSRLSYDKNCDEFIRWRRKVESAMESEVPDALKK